jgi:hypothetical protein
MTNFVRIVHPITGRFICEYDPVRDIMLVVDRGKEAIIDLAQYKGGNNEYTGIISNVDNANRFLDADKN